MDSHAPVLSPSEHPEESSTDENLPPTHEKAEAIAEDNTKLTSYPTLMELKSMVDEHKADEPIHIEPPSIEPLKDFIKKRAATIEGLKKVRARIARHITKFKISNTVGNSASIIGGILCFVFPPVGVPVLLAGGATSLGTTITESVIEKRFGTECTGILEEDSLAMKVCESNLKDITSWLVTVYSLGYHVSKAGVNLFKLSEAIQAASTLGTWGQLVGQLPSLASALATGAKTAGTISGRILGVSVIISVADLVQTWISKNATLESIDKDIVLLEQQLKELQRIADAYPA